MPTTNLLLLSSRAKYALSIQQIHARLFNAKRKSYRMLLEFDENVTVGSNNVSSTLSTLHLAKATLIPQPSSVLQLLEFDQYLCFAKPTQLVLTSNSVISLVPNKLKPKNLNKGFAMSTNRYLQSTQYAKKKRVKSITTRE